MTLFFFGKTGKNLFSPKVQDIFELKIFWDTLSRPWHTFQTFQTFPNKRVPSSKRFPIETRQYYDFYLLRCFFFSCPSSSIPTEVTDWMMIHHLEFKSAQKCPKVLKIAPKCPKEPKVPKSAQKCTVCPECTVCLEWSNVPRVTKKCPETPKPPRVPKGVKNAQKCSKVPKKCLGCP